MMRPTPRPNSSKVWLPVGARDLESMKEGQALLKTLEGGMWKWHVTNPGNSRMANFQCNGHEDCKRELRVVKVNDVYMIQGRGSHGVIPKERKRANSTLTVGGAGGCWSRPISAQGRHGWPDRCAALHDDMNTSPLTPEIRVPHVSLHVSTHVSRMYPACILITSEDTCIPHVSCMEPSCIPHLRYVPLKIHLRYMYLFMYLGCIPHVS